MERAEALKVIKILSGLYPKAVPQLDFGTPFQLLTAVILSAQCTDKRVNEVTKELFKVAGTPQKMAAMPREELEGIIYTCGFYRNKASHLLSASRRIIEEFGGEVPRTLEGLQKLDGVGRKTANVVYSVAFGGDAIAVDTHVFRVSNRLGLASAKDVLKTELELMEILPKEIWSKAHHLLIYHGRNICKAQRPLCNSCGVNLLCRYYKEQSAFKE